MHQFHNHHTISNQTTHPLRRSHQTQQQSQSHQTKHSRTNNTTHNQYKQNSQLHTLTRQSKYHHNQSNHSQQRSPTTTNHHTPRPHRRPQYHQNQTHTHQPDLRQHLRQHRTLKPTRNNPNTTKTRNHPKRTPTSHTNISHSSPQDHTQKRTNSIGQNKYSPTTSQLQHLHQRKHQRTHHQQSLRHISHTRLRKPRKLTQHRNLTQVTMRNHNLNRHQPRHQSTKIPHVDTPVVHHNHTFIFNSRVSASILTPNPCVGGPLTRLTQRYVRTISPNFTAHIHPNSVIINNINFNVNSSHRRTIRTLLRLNINTIITGNFTQVFCHGTLGLKLPTLIYRSLRTDRNSRLRTEPIRNHVVGRAQHHRCTYRPVPNTLVRIITTNKLVP